MMLRVKAYTVEECIVVCLFSFLHALMPSFSRKFSPFAAFSQKRLPRNKQLIDTTTVQNKTFNIVHGPKKLLRVSRP